MPKRSRPKCLWSLVYIFQLYVWVWLVFAFIYHPAKRSVHLPFPCWLDIVGSLYVCVKPSITNSPQLPIGLNTRKNKILRETKFPKKCTGKRNINHVSQCSSVCFYWTQNDRKFHGKMYIIGRRHCLRKSSGWQLPQNAFSFMHVFYRCLDTGEEKKISK